VKISPPFDVKDSDNLDAHGLARREYKRKYGIPSKTSLSARSLLAKRRRFAKERGLGEKLAKVRRKKK
jgi:predicted transcriptional regulator